MSTSAVSSVCVVVMGHRPSRAGTLRTLRPGTDNARRSAADQPRPPAWTAGGSDAKPTATPAELGDRRMLTVTAAGRRLDLVVWTTAGLIWEVACSSATS